MNASQAYDNRDETGKNLSRDLSVPKPKGDEEDEICNKVEREQ